ncbi:MAG: Gfo/Idh/MocA family oxidoreductase [Thermodesulfobacteriota bacterium]|nr:Gfo/Idh/MocA family oxidoreductase [Thermodesulfobacteriota bacterium]
MKIAVIGAGYWGKNLIRNFDSLGVLGVICDKNRGTLEECGKVYPHIDRTDSFQSVLNDPSIEALAVASPAEMHYRMVKECLLAEKHVLVEKPLALHEEEGIEVNELAVERKKILMVGHLLQYHPGIMKLKQLVSDGELGKIQYIYSNRLNLGKIRREENILWSFAPHDISVILSLSGEMPESVTSMGANYLHQQVADVTLSSLSFPSGIKAHIFVSWLHPYKEQKLVVVGDRKMALFNDVEPKDKLLLYPHRIEWKDHIPVPDKGEAEKVSIEKKEPLKEECNHFIHCISNSLRPKTDGEEALRVLRVLQACQESLEHAGKSVSVETKSREPHGSGIFIHETSVIDPGCEVGRGTKIWHFSHIIKGSKIGENCNIGQNVVVGPDVSIGDRVKIQNNVSVYPGVTLEDGVFCGPSMVFTNVYNPRSYIPRKTEIRSTLVRKGATLGANSTIVCGHTIGQFSFVGAGAVVIDDIPDYALIVGNPAEIKGWMCQCGIRLHFDGGYGTCDVCGLKYSKKENLVKRIE